MARLSADMRRWLNPKSHCDTGAVQADFKVRIREDFKQLGATLTIRDCSEQIDLDFSIYDHNRENWRREVSNRQKKIDHLRAALNLMEEGLERYTQESVKQEEKNAQQSELKFHDTQ